MRKILKPMQEKVTRNRRQFPNDEIYNFYPPSDIVSVLKLKRIDNFEDLVVNGRIIYKYSFNHIF